MLNLNQKNIFITGASSGIGKACAILASNLGANVILIGRNKERLQETLNNLKEGNHLHYAIDITDYSILEKIIDESVEKIGKISGFIHSAGIETTKPLQAMSAPVYEKLFATNIISAFEISKHLSKKKNLDTMGASFVFISSIMALYGKKGIIGYGSSKSALIGGVKAMALELAPKNIRVNCILPGLVETEMTQKMLTSLPGNYINDIKNKYPLGIGKPEDVANSTIFLMSDLSKWITGIDFIVDGGYHIE